MTSKLNILINPCTKNNKLLSLVEARVRFTRIGFQFKTYQFILNSKTRKEKGDFEIIKSKENKRSKKKTNK